jgi:hypothetical protein
MSLNRIWKVLVVTQHNLGSLKIKKKKLELSSSFFKKLKILKYILLSKIQLIVFFKKKKTLLLHYPLK